MGRAAEVHEFREELLGGGAGLEEVLPLQVASAPTPRHAGQLLRTVLRQRRALARLEKADVLGLVAPGHDPDAVPIQVERAGQASGLGRHGVRMAVVQDVGRRAHAHR